MKHPPIVQIKWVDSNQPVGQWRWLEDIEPEGVVCLSVGFLLRDTPEVKVIALSLGSNGGDEVTQAAGVQTIPAAAVLEITHLPQPHRP